MFNFQKFYLLFMATSSVIFGLETVNVLDLNKYSGRWYQVYGNKFDLTFQGRSKCITADYTIVPDKNVSVLNSQYTLNGELEQIEGFAYYSDNVDSKEEPGKLTVHLDGVPRDSPYWVLNIGSEVDGYYDWAIVSDPFGLSLFVLARNVDRYYDNYDDYVLTLLKDYGFDNPIQIEHDNCDYVQEPTNEIYFADAWLCFWCHDDAEVCSCGREGLSETFSCERCDSGPLYCGIQLSSCNVCAPESVCCDNCDWIAGEDEMQEVCEDCGEEMLEIHMREDCSGE